MLDFTPNAVHSGIYTALARDYDGAEGVQMRIRRPGESTDALRLLETERIDFAILSISDLAIAREKGSEVVGVMAVVQRPLAAVFARPGITSPGRLEGRRAGVTGLPSDVAVLDSVVRGAGGNPERVRRTDIGFAAVPALLGLVVLGRTTIRILFEHGEFDAAAGSLTYDVLVAYAVALPAYVATEVITRGLIALRDTRTPLLTNTVQLAGRAVLIALLLDRHGAVAIPIAFAVTASVETVALGAVLLTKLRRREQGLVLPAPTRMGA